LDPDKRCVRVRITSSPGITRRTFERSKYQRYWWLYKPLEGYVKLPKIRGHLGLDVIVDLAPDQYILGVGPADYRGKRRTINIFEDRAEVVAFFDTTATIIDVQPEEPASL